MAAAASATMEAGWIWKSGARKTTSGFKQRWFKVNGSKLEYYKKPDSKKPNGTIDLADCRDFRKAGACHAAPTRWMFIGDCFLPFLGMPWLSQRHLRLC